MMPMVNTATMILASENDEPFWNSSHTNFPRPGFCASISAAISTIQPTPSDSRRPVKIDGVAAGAFGYILTLRLIPLAPFWLVNVAAALAHAPLGPYALATFIGIMPATFIYSGIGAGIGDLLARNEAPDLGVIFQPNILGPLVALGLLSLGVTLYQRRRAKTGETL